MARRNSAEMHEARRLITENGLTQARAAKATGLPASAISRSQWYREFKEKILSESKNTPDSSPAKPKRGRPQGRALIEWTADEIAMLGTVPDIQIATKKRVSGVTVAKKRRYFRIPAFQPQIHQLRKFSPQEIEILRSQSSGQAAKILGLKIHTVNNARVALGIRRALPLKNFPLFDSLVNISQPDFYKKISEHYKNRTGESLTHKKLAKMCKWSVTRINHWFSTGTSQENLALPIRHHIWLSIIFCIDENILKNRRDFTKYADGKIITKKLDNDQNKNAPAERG